MTRTDIATVIERIRNGESADDWGYFIDINYTMAWFVKNTRLSFLLNKAMREKRRDRPNPHIRIVRSACTFYGECLFDDNKDNKNGRDLRLLLVQYNDNGEVLTDCKQSEYEILDILSKCIDNNMSVRDIHGNDI